METILCSWYEENRWRCAWTRRLHYSTFRISIQKLIDKKGKAIYIRIDNDDELLDDNHSKLSEISLEVRYQEYDTVENDCYYGSEYLLSAMNRVGEAIRQNVHLFP